MLCALVLTASFACAIAQQPEPDAASLLDADRARARAMVEVDRPALAVLLHDELSYAHSTGRIESKEQLTASLETADVDYLSIFSAMPLARIHGRSGVVTGPVDMQVLFEGETIDVRSVYTAIYVFGPEGWQLLAYQSTRRTEP